MLGNYKTKEHGKCWLYIAPLLYYCKISHQTNCRGLFWCTQHCLEPWFKNDFVSCEHKKFLNSELRLKPSPVNTKFYDMKSRLRCKWYPWTFITYTRFLCTPENPLWIWNTKNLPPPSTPPYVPSCDHLATLLFQNLYNAHTPKHINIESWHLTKFLSSIVLSK